MSMETLYESGRLHAKIDTQCSPRNLAKIRSWTTGTEPIASDVAWRIHPVTRPLNMNQMIPKQQVYISTSSIVVQDVMRHEDKLILKQSA